MTATESRTFWLSFTDPSRPAGDKFVGVAVVDVTAAEAAAVRPALPPQAQPGSEWMAAACRRAWDTGCNPGGNVGTIDISTAHEAEIMPRNRLLSKAELIELGVIDS